MHFNLDNIEYSINFSNTTKPGGSTWSQTSAPTGWWTSMSSDFTGQVLIAGQNHDAGGYYGRGGVFISMSG